MNTDDWLTDTVTYGERKRVNKKAHLEILYNVAEQYREKTLKCG